MKLRGGATITASEVPAARLPLTEPFSFDHDPVLLGAFSHSISLP
jgi:hypothetical protein